MKRFAILSAAAVAVALLSPTGAEAQQACYHCAYATDGSSFCHPISSSGHRGCNGNDPTVLVPSGCSFSGSSCSNTVYDLRSDGRILASNSTTAPAGETLERRDCDGAIIARSYTAQAAQRARVESRTIRI